MNETKSNVTLTYALTSLMTLFWSLNYIAAKLAIRSFPPLMLATFRMLIAGAMMMAVYAWWARGRDTLPIRRWPVRDLLWNGVLGVVGMAGNQILFVIGMGHTSVAHGALIIATAPVLVLLLAWMRGQEHLTRRKLAGLALALGGVAALNLAPGKSTHGATFMGDAFVFSCALAFALYTVFTKESTARYGAMPLTALGYAACGALLAVPVGLEVRDFNFAVVTPLGWSMLIYMAAISSVACYVIYSYALGHLPASRVASFSYAQPFMASVAGYFILGEPVTTGVAVGGTMVLGGVWLVSRG